MLQRRDGAFLLSQRPAGKPYAGYWEFPGGKIESGESAAAGLTRELHEELGIDVKLAYPWITRDYDYEHASVRLRFFRVTEWSGELHGKESQAFSWQRVDALSVSPLLPANGPILRALALPVFYGISNAHEVGAREFLRRLELALDSGLKLVQIREKGLGDDDLVDLASRARELAHARGAQVLVNGDPGLAGRAGVDGVHLSASRLMGLDARPACALVGASCHDERELAQAASLGVDFAVLGPVQPTASHSGTAVLGWQRFTELAARSPLPIYAIGGLTRNDLAAAWNAGAHGIAAIRAAWLAG